MSYSNMNSKYRSVEDTVVSKNVLSELGLSEISNKLRVVSGTLNLTGLAAATPASIIGQDGNPIYLPRSAYVEKVILRFDGSGVLSGGGSLQVGVSTISAGVLGATANFTTPITGILIAEINGGTVYHTDYMVLNDTNNYLVSGTVTGSLSGVVRVNVYLSLP